MYYFDNAATTIEKPKCVADAMYDAITSKLGNPARSTHDYSINALEKLFEVRLAICEFFQADSALNIVLSPNITYALNIVINALLDTKDHVITTDSEHNSVLRPLYYMATKGMEISFLKLDELAQVDISNIETLIKSNTKAIIIQHASNVSGNINDIKMLAELCYKHGLYLIVDGAQSAGCIDINLKEIKYPLVYCFTGHKSLYGPQGTGGFIINGEYPFKQVFSGGSASSSFNQFQPTGLPDFLEFGTANLHSNLGLKAAISYLKDIGMDEVEHRLKIISNYFYNQLQSLSIDKIRFYGNFKSRRVPIVSFNIPDISSTYFADIMWNRYKIAVRGAIHCAPRYHEAMNTADHGQIRFSFSLSNTKEQVDYAIDAISDFLSEYGKNKG